MNDVLQSLEADLSRTHPVILSDMQGAANSNAPAILAIRTAIANIQCFDIDPEKGEPDPKLRLRNPLIPVVTGPLQLTVQGQLSEGGTITVGSPTATTGATTITRQGQQQIMLPTTLVPLVNVPVFYLGQQLAAVQNTSSVSTATTYNLTAAQVVAENKIVNDYVSRSLDAMAGLNGIITNALDQFDNNRDEYCKGRDGGKGPPVFIAIPAE